MEGELTRISDSMAARAGYLPRIVLIEDEYRITVLRAELTWVRALIDELRDGRFSWDEEQLRKLAAQTPQSTPAG
jgi:hypothetical protein